MEFMAVSSTPYDTDRFGAPPRFVASIRSADGRRRAHAQAGAGPSGVYEQMCGSG
jgi:hypothetical protein